MQRLDRKIYRESCQDERLLICLSVYLFCMLCCDQSLSCVRLSAVLWTISSQAPLSMGILQARILEWVAIFLQGIFPTQGSNLHLLNWQIIYHGATCIPPATAAAKSLQLCPTLCNPIDGSPPGSPVPGILQARTLEWVAIAFSNAWKWKVKVKSLSCVRLFVTLWTAAYQAPLSMRFSRREYWSGVSSSSPCISPIEW